MIAQSEVELHVEGFSEGSEEVQDKFRFLVGGDMHWYTMLRKDVEQEELCKLRGRDGVVGRDENGLLGQLVNHDKDGGEARRGWELLYEIHQDGIPGSGWDQ